MSTPHLFLRLLWVAAFAVTLTVPVQAQNRQRNDDRSDRRYERDFQIDRNNSRTYDVDQTVVARDGERFRVEGQLRVAARVREENDGDLRVAGRVDGSDLTVTRMRDRQVFRVNGTDQVNGTFDSPNRDRATVSTVVDFNLVSPGEAPNYRLFLTLEGDVDRDGDLNGRVTGMRIEGRGRDGRDDRRYERDFQIDRNNARTYDIDQTIVARDGERFRVEGPLRLTAHVRRQGDGELHVTGSADGSGLTVTRLDNRQVFDVRGTDEVSETFREPERGSATVSTVVDFGLVPTGRETAAQRSNPSYRIFLTLEGEVDRNGDLNGRITNMRIQ